LIRSLLAAVLGVFALSSQAAPWPELKFVAEYPVEGMRGGNLSGLALCKGELWTVSDRDDDLIYRLNTQAPVWQAESVPVAAPGY